MPDTVENVSLEILKNIQASIAKLTERMDQLSGRFDHLEAGLRKDRRNVAGMLVMMRATAGDFDERIYRGRRARCSARSIRAVTIPKNVTRTEDTR